MGGLETLGLGGILKLDTRIFTVAMSKARRSFASLKQGAERVGPAAAGLSASIGAMSAKVRAAGAKVVAAARNMATKVSVQFNRMRQASAKVGRGLAKLGGAMRTGVMAALPLTAALGFGVVQGASFEKQMYGVSAITGATGKDFEELKDHALKMGMASVFSATESAEAMEFMGMAGFKNTEIMTGLEGILGAAAATNVGLAEATSIVAERIRGFGLAASDTSRVADVLALATARTNTNITALSEGMKYATPMAKMMGVSLEETTTILGMLADAGLKGSVGGTALKNALIKLSKPTSAAAKQIAKMGLTIKDSSGDFVGMQSIMTQLTKGVNVYGGNVDRAAAMSELFGLRGMGLTTMLDRMNKATAAGALTYGELRAQLESAGGAAKKMAEVRIKGLSGSFKMLMSAIEAANIVALAPMLAPFARVIGGVAAGMRSVIGAMGDLSGATDEQAKSQSFLTGLVKEYGPTAVAVAEGVRGAIDKIRGTFNFVIDAVKKFMGTMKESMGDKTISKIVEMVVIIGVAAAAFAPVIAAVLGAALVVAALGAAITAIPIVIGGLISAIVAIGGAFATVASVVLSPIGLIVAAVVGIGIAIYVFRDQIWAVLTAVGGWIADLATAVWTYLEPVRAAIGFLLILPFKMAEAGIQEIIGWVSRLATTALPYLRIFWGAIKKVGGAIWTFVVRRFQSAWGLVKTVGTAVGSFAAGAWPAIKKIGMSILNFLLWPLRKVLGVAVSLGEALGMKVPAGLKTFVEKGFGAPGEEARPAARVAKRRATATAEIAEAKAITITKERAREKARETRIDTDAMEKAVETGAARGTAGRKTTIENKIDLTVDGREAAYASAEHTQEIQERAGFKATPWQRRLSLEQGLPMPALVAIPRG